MPAISLLGTDYATLDAWWDAENTNDYSGAGPILEVPAGLAAMLTANHQFRYGTVSKATIRAVSGDEFVGSMASPASIATLDCGGFELDFRNDNIIFEDIYLTNFTVDNTGDTWANCGFRRCGVDGYLDLDQAFAAAGMFGEDTTFILNSGEASTERVINIRNACDLNLLRCTVINKAGGGSDGAVFNRSTLAISIVQTVIYSPTNNAYATLDSPPAPTTSNNAASDASLPGAVITNITSAIFENYATGDYRIKNDSAPATMGTPAGAFIVPTVQVSPQLDSNIPDLPIGEGAASSYDTSAHFSDGNPSDTLTFSILPDISLVTGFSFNTATGVVTWDGTQVQAGAIDYTVTADDGEVGNTPATDVFAVTVTAAVPGINNIDIDNIIYAGQTAVTINASNLDTNPTVKTATLGGKALTVTNWNAGMPVVDIATHIDLRPGIGYQLAVTDDTGTVTLDNVMLVAPIGWLEIIWDGTIPDLPSTKSLYESSITDAEIGNYTMIAGDVPIYETMADLTYDAQTKPIIFPPHDVTHSFKIWKAATSEYTPVSTMTWLDGGVVADIIAPDFVTGPVAAIIAQSTFDINFTPDEGGSFRYVVLANGATTPTVDEVLAGTGNAGATPAFATALLSMSEGTPISTTASGLGINTEYDVHLAVTDATGNKRLAAVIDVTTSSVNAGPIVTAPADTTLEFPNGGAGLAHDSANFLAWLALATVTDDASVVTVSPDLAGLPNPITAGVWSVEFNSTPDAEALVGQDTAQLTVAEAIVNIPQRAVITGVVNYLNDPVTQLYEHWVITDSDPEMVLKTGGTANAIDAGEFFLVTAGGGQVSAPNAVLGNTYTLVAFTTDKTHVIHIPVTIVAE